MKTGVYRLLLLYVNISVFLYLLEHVYITGFSKKEKQIIKNEMFSYGEKVS